MLLSLLHSDTEVIELLKLSVNLVPQVSLLDHWESLTRLMRSSGIGIGAMLEIKET